jgi:hypothetical protein
VFHLDLLLKSKEMKALVGCTQSVALSTLHSGGAVVSSAGCMIVHTASLPVKIPLKIATSAVGLVVAVTGQAARFVFGDSSSCGESSSSSTPIEGWIHGILGAVPSVVGTAGQITQDVRSAAVGAVGAVFGMENTTEEDEILTSPRPVTSSGERSAEQDFFLHRLRLDIHLPEYGQELPPSVIVSAATPADTSKHLLRVSAATPADTSKHLLRVDDLNVCVSQDDLAAPINSSKAMFVDLGKDFSDESLTVDALDQLIEKGRNIAGSNANANVALHHPLQDRGAFRIDWKPERSTSKYLRNMRQLSIMDCYENLEKNVLIWSGKYRGPKYYGSDNPFFFARGIVKRSPREFLNLMWDSSRTHEYNQFSLGRKDVVVIEDNLPEGGSYGAKVIKSETSVPFTGLSVTLSVLMHARALEGGSEDGFIIVSRSLSSGMAGCHVSPAQRVEMNAKNEVLLGVNVMRAVPGKPELTDLLSISQVSSKMVPQFLAFKIGMMGVEDFFKTVRE